MAEAYMANTIEVIEAIDDPTGVSWLAGHSLVMDSHPDYQIRQEAGTEGEENNRYGVFPVSSVELLGKKGTALAVGDMFKLRLNLGAGSPADVMPEVLEYVPPVTDKEFNKFLRDEG
ncbi:MAG: hypothetical protein ABIQ64_00475 [Candidatus Saccharimonadales bacterium]